LKLLVAGARVSDGSNRSRPPFGETATEEEETTMFSKAFIVPIAALVLGATAIGGIALAQRQTPAPAMATENQSLPPSNTAPSTPTPAPAAAPAPAGSQANVADRAARQQRRDDFLNTLAQNLGISRPTLNTALQTSFDQEIDKAVAANELTPQQAARLKKRIGNDKFPLGVGIGDHQNTQPTQQGAN
jgi:hypothetical protein